MMESVTEKFKKVFNKIEKLSLLVTSVSASKNSILKYLEFEETPP